jgi:RNA polymerase sigma factor (sigma-70 family)
MKARLAFLTQDARVLDLIRRGDEGALVTLYRSCRRQVVSMVLGNSGTLDDAEDILQEAVVVLWERVRAGRFEASARLETFVYATARNLWLRRLARARREVSLPDQGQAIQDPDLPALERMIDDEGAGIVAETLALLGEPCRTLLLLFYWEERPMEEIASLLGFANAATAKSKKYQCKKALEQLLSERYHGQPPAAAS